MFDMMVTASGLLRLLSMVCGVILASALDFTISRPTHGDNASLDPATAAVLGIDPAASFYGTIAAAEAADMCDFVTAGGTATDAYVDYGSHTKPYHMKLVKTMGCSGDGSPAGSQSLFDISGTNQQVAVICGSAAGTESDECETFVAFKQAHDTSAHSSEEL